MCPGPWLSAALALSALGGLGLALGYLTLSTRLAQLERFTRRLGLRQDRQGETLSSIASAVGWRDTRADVRVLPSLQSPAASSTPHPPPLPSVDGSRDPC